MIVEYPDMPPLGDHGHKQGSLILLHGGRHGGRWQHAMALKLDKQVGSSGSIVMTPKQPLTMDAWSLLVEAADAIAFWIGDGFDVPYLEEWVHLGYALGVAGDRLLVGVDPRCKHPMKSVVEGLSPVWTSEDDLRTALALRCSNMRG